MLTVLEAGRRMVDSLHHLFTFLMFEMFHNKRSLNGLFV